MMNTQIVMPHVTTIARAAALSGLPIYRVRVLAKEGKIVTIQCGRKTLINCDSLAQYLSRGDTPTEDTGSVRQVAIR